MDALAWLPTAAAECRLGAASIVRLGWSSMADSSRSPASFSDNSKDSQKPRSEGLHQESIRGAVRGGASGRSRSATLIEVQLQRDVRRDEGELGGCTQDALEEQIEDGEAHESLRGI